MDWSRGRLAIGLILLGVFGGVGVAQADPHAIFYTSIGQQQLFFNVLAALDQADYVETQDSRESTVSERAGVTANPPFEPEGLELLDSTQVGRNRSASEPGVSDLLARSITLEGNDLYNDQLIRQLGAEFARRNGTSELLRALCSYGLGLIDCELDSRGKSQEEIAETEAKKRAATVVDPLQWDALPVLQGAFGVLLSGTEFDTQLRRSMLLDKSKSLGPRAYSADVASWRVQAERNNTTDLLDSLLKQVASEYLWPIRDYPLKDVVITPDGEVGLSYSLADYDSSSGGSEVPFAERYERTAIDLSLAGAVVRDLAEAGANRVRVQQRILEDEGLLGQYTLTNHPPKLASSSGSGSANPPSDESPGEQVNPPTGSTGSSPQSPPTAVGELTANITNPVAVREANVYGLPNILGMADTSQLFSALIGIDTPGGKELVDRAGTSVPTPSPTAPPSPGDIESPGEDVNPPIDSPGDVLGVLNLFDESGSTTEFFNFDAPRTGEETSPSANIVVPHLEQGMVQALRVITGGEWRPAKETDPPCGFTCRP